MICIYHSKDLDGYCSAAIIKKRYPEARLIGYDYGDPIPVTADDLRGEDLILVDVSFPMAVMNELAIFPKSFVWIDHHATAIDEFHQKQLGDLITAVVKTGIAACELTWSYLYPHDPVPTSVQLLGEYDTWRDADTGKWKIVTLPFQYGMRMQCHSPATFPDDLLGDSPWQAERVGEIIIAGRTVLAYQKQQNERACRSAFEIEFEGYKAICLNVGGADSMMFESVYKPEKHDLMIAFFFTGTRWTISLRTTHHFFDCGLLAKRYGGGGHAKAARFSLPELPLAFQKHVVWPAVEKEGSWQVKAHHYATGGDEYDGYFEITNGKISIYAKEDSDTDELEAVARTLSASDCHFYLDDSAAFCLAHLEKMTKELDEQRCAFRAALQEIATTEMSTIAKEALQKYPSI